MMHSPRQSYKTNRDLVLFLNELVVMEDDQDDECLKTLPNLTVA